MTEQWCDYLSALSAYINYNVFESSESQRLVLTLVRMEGEGGKKPPPYQLFPCNFYKRWN